MPLGFVRPVQVWLCWPLGCLLWLTTTTGFLSAQSIDRPAALSPPVWDDPSLTPADRVRRALDAATALDEQAQRAPSVAISRAKWQEAARVLDAFLAKNGSNPAAASVQFQAAVYLWARARALLDQVDLLAATDPDRVDVTRGLDDVIERLRQIKPEPVQGNEVLAQNIRFRLAQSLADRARLWPDLDPARINAEKEAQRLLDRSLDAPRLKVFARLLHAELANRLGEFGPAQIEVEEIEKYKPAPPLIPLTDARINALAGRAEFAEAIAVADRTAASPEQKAFWKLRIALARRKLAPPGRDRQAAAAAVFEAALPLRNGNRPESVRGLMELARAIDELAAGSPAEWWDLLADGQLLLHNPERAARFATRAADQVGSDAGDRAGLLRVKAGACWFQTGNYSEADAVLTQVVENPAASHSIRAKAGMLRAMSRGRALADHLPGTSKQAYQSALESQVRDFGAEPVSAEARWILGKVRAAAQRQNEAISLWSGVQHGQPRWLEAQTAAADLLIEGIEAQWVNRDVSTVGPQVAAARKLIGQALDQATPGDEEIALGIRVARLESIPGAASPAEAVKVLDRLLRAPASPAQHRELRLDRMVALAELNRFAEADLIGRSEAKGSEILAILPTIRLLDQWASTTEGDLIRKRTGSLLRVLLDPWSDPIDRSPESVRDEVQLRFVRALLFTGDAVGAKRALSRWGGPVHKIDDPAILRDLGDTYFRLEAYALAVDAERLRGGRLAAGSPGWFDARYLLSLALYRSDRGKEARQVIDATSILHPDLGGGEIRTKFERLSQKINIE